eukprot:scaffold321958_cov31-Tisochrysis_lutea.AAC.4
MQTATMGSSLRSAGCCNTSCPCLGSTGSAARTSLRSADSGRCCRQSALMATAPHRNSQAAP